VPCALVRMEETPGQERTRSRARLRDHAGTSAQAARLTGNARVLSRGGAPSA